MSDQNKASALIAITTGDPAGIGPEISLKMLADSSFAEHSQGLRPILIGDFDWLCQTAKDFEVAIELEPVTVVDSSLEFAHRRSIAVPVLSPGPPLIDVTRGQLDARCGQSAFDSIKAAIDLALRSQISGIVTAPIHKEALAAAGVPFPGHTEMLASYAGVEEVAMMLANDHIKVVLVSIHRSLREAIESVNTEAVLRTIRFADQGARAFGIAAPRVAVAGLNPHAGEGGLFGDEEIEFISPAIERANREGIAASGPWAGDTVFMRARSGEFDVVVAQYHDQGLIPVKYLGLSEGVNITLGLPFVRTSPDHGTAFDIASHGVADPASLRAAYSCAVQLIRSHRRE